MGYEHFHLYWDLAWPWLNLGNMAPEFGSTCGIFPIDGDTIRYMKLSGRDDAQCELVEAYAREQGMWREDGQPDALYTDILELDMGTVEPSIAGPKRPQDRIALSAAATSYEKILADTVANREAGGSGIAKLDGEDVSIDDGSILIAAITSCTNTSNPAVMVAAGLVARNAAAKGLKAKPWVKTSLAPGSRVVSDYLEKAELSWAPACFRATAISKVVFTLSCSITSSHPLPWSWPTPLPAT
jgi:aconitate hydratase